VIGTNVQAFDTDLTTWSGITPGANVGTFLATPSSANLRAALTDENGTGAALFDAATSPSFTTPKITTSIQDANAKTVLGITATASAVNSITLANAATGAQPTNNPSLTLAGSDADIGLTIFPKGLGYLIVSSASTSGTTLKLTNGSVGGKQWDFNSQGSGNGQPGDFAFYNGTNTIIDLSGTRVGTYANGTFGWWSDTSFAGAGSYDTALGRNAAGVVEVNNGTLGTFRDIKVDKVNAVTGYRVNGAAPTNYELTGNGTNFVPKASDIPNGSSTQQTGFAANQYLTGSAITVNAGDFVVGTTYRCVFDMTKTTAGTAAPIITIHIGTAGTTSDTAAQTISFAAATGVADTGTFEVWVNFRAVGASATIASMAKCAHNLAATGLTSTGAAGVGVVSNTTSSTFSSTAATKIGIGFNGGASYVGTNNIVQAYLAQP
jgi:hypothetical protein